MKLIVQPRDGLASVTNAFRSAKKEIHIVVFRLDRDEIEAALEAAVKRGVTVHALIAHTNHGGEKRLRKLEQALLDAGASVARTGDELTRYHGKFFIIDRTTLWILGFNYTGRDTSGTRSFGIVTKHRSDVQQALKLFEADRGRQPYEPAKSGLIISPENARAALGDFIQKAKRQLLIWDPKVGDPAMLKLLNERAKRGVDVRVLGKVGKKAEFHYEKFPNRRLHVRAMVRDGRDAFIGSQSLRKLELDNRREVGIVVRNATVVREMLSTFEEDWALTDSGHKAKKKKHRGSEVAA